jgi:hypothetical protein
LKGGGLHIGGGGRGDAAARALGGEGLARAEGDGAAAGIGGVVPRDGGGGAVAGAGERLEIGGEPRAIDGDAAKLDLAGVERGEALLLGPGVGAVEPEEAGGGGILEGVGGEAPPIGGGEVGQWRPSMPVRKALWRSRP